MSEYGLKEYLDKRNTSELINIETWVQLQVKFTHATGLHSAV